MTNPTYGPLLALIHVLYGIYWSIHGFSSCCCCLWWRMSLLGILETSFNGRSTRNERNIRKSTSTLASAKIVIELHKFSIFFFIFFFCSSFCCVCRYWWSAYVIHYYHSIADKYKFIHSIRELLKYWKFNFNRNVWCKIFINQMYEYVENLNINLYIYLYSIVKMWTYPVTTTKKSIMFQIFLR